MKPAPFDTTGHSLDRAREIAQRAGWRITGVTRIGPARAESQERREVVVRQVAQEDESVELVVAGVWAAARRAETANEQ